MNCRRCGGEIDTRKKEKGGSVRCPSCGAVYLLKTSADQRPEEKAAGSRPGAAQAPGRNAAGKQTDKASGKKEKQGGPKVLLAAAVLLLAAAAVSFLLFVVGSTVSFSLGYETKERAPARQRVKPGEHAVEPATPLREGYVFIGWYTGDSQSCPYDFKSPVRKSVALTGKWADLSDTQDTDGDGLPDSIESSIGTDGSRSDTDDDGLSDYVEFKILRLDPLSRDTNGNGVPDGSEDQDGDGLTNAEEIRISTSPISEDTDGDGLTDREESREHQTSPVNRDTDSDGADDWTEIVIGSDPLTAEDLFTTSVSAPPVSEGNPMSLSVSAETDSSGAGRVTVTPLTTTSIPALSPSARGYLGSAYEVHTDGTLFHAVLTFRYDPALGMIGEEFLPCIYYYDEVSRELVELENQHVENGLVSADTIHFSYYTVLNKVAVDAAKRLAGLPGELDLSDPNNDGLPDIYAEWINAGDLLYDNSDMLFGVLDLFGRDSDDWDGDGLKNGEEISVNVGPLGVWIVNRSNPVLRDSDLDGINDYVEVRELGSDPLRYDRRSLGALHQLTNDGRYLYMNHEKDWQDHLALFFDGDKYDKAKECLIDYLYDYAAEETIEKNAELIARQAAFENGLEIYGSLCRLGKSVFDLKGVLATGTDDAILEQNYLEITQARKNMLDGFNREDAWAFAPYAQKMDQTWLNSVFGGVSSLSFPDELQDLISSYESGSVTRQIEGLTSALAATKNALEIYHGASELQSLSVAKELSDYAAQVDKMRGQVLWTKPSASSMVITVVFDVAETGGELMDIYDTYSKVKANADAFNMYLELLLYIRDHASEDYVRNAAADLAKMVLDNGGGEFFAQLADACGKKLTDKAFKTALDLLAKGNPLMAIGKTFMDLYKKTGMTDLAKYNVYFDVMREVSRGAEALLFQAVREESQTFSYREKNAAWVEKYLVQLAQSRIIGEYFYSEYCASDSGAASLAKALSGRDESDWRAIFREEAKEIYDYANRLQLKLSKNLPYYENFWSDSVQEDGLEISTMLLPPEDYPEACQAYLELLQKERAAINGYIWQMGYYGFGEQTENQISRPVVLCNIWGDDTPELLYVKRETDYSATMVIVAYENGQLRQLYSSQWDVLAGGGTGYYFFQLNGEPKLYVFLSGGDLWLRETYSSFEESADGTLTLSQRLMRYSGSDDGGVSTPPDYQKDGESIAKEDFDRALLQMQHDTTGILMYNLRAGEFVQNYLRSIDCPAMTCEEAIAYLRGLLGISGAEEAWSEAYREFVLSREFLTFGDPGAGYGELEGGLAPVTFAMHDIDGDEVPELLIFNGFNGRDLQANYVFTFTGSEVVYCGKTYAAVWTVEDYPGLFASLTTTGWYVPDEYAGRYDEVTSLNYVTLRGTTVAEEAVSMTGLPVGSTERMEFFRTDNTALYEAALRPRQGLETSTWAELNTQGWEAFAEP